MHKNESADSATATTTHLFDFKLRTKLAKIATESKIYKLSHRLNKNHDRYIAGEELEDYLHELRNLTFGSSMSYKWKICFKCWSVFIPSKKINGEPIRDLHHPKNVGSISALKHINAAEESLTSWLIEDVLKNPDYSYTIFSNQNAKYFKGIGFAIKPFSLMDGYCTEHKHIPGKAYVIKEEKAPRYLKDPIYEDGEEGFVEKKHRRKKQKKINSEGKARRNRRVRYDREFSAGKRLRVHRNRDELSQPFENIQKKKRRSQKSSKGQKTVLTNHLLENSDDFLLSKRAYSQIHQQNSNQDKIKKKVKKAAVIEEDVSSIVNSSEERKREGNKEKLDLIHNQRKKRKARKGSKNSRGQARQKKRLRKISTALLENEQYDDFSQKKKTKITRKSKSRSKSTKKKNKKKKKRRKEAVEKLLGYGNDIIYFDEDEQQGQLIDEEFEGVDLEDEFEDFQPNQMNEYLLQQQQKQHKLKRGKRAKSKNSKRMRSKPVDLEQKQIKSTKIVEDDYDEDVNEVLEPEHQYNALSNRAVHHKSQRRSESRKHRRRAAIQPQTEPQEPYTAHQQRETEKRHRSKSRLKLKHLEEIKDCLNKLVESNNKILESVEEQKAQVAQILAEQQKKDLASQATTNTLNSKIEVMDLKVNDIKDHVHKLYNLIEDEGGADLDISGPQAKDTSAGPLQAVAIDIDSEKSNAALSHDDSFLTPVVNSFRYSDATEVRNKSRKRRKSSKIIPPFDEELPRVKKVKRRRKKDQLPKRKVTAMTDGPHGYLSVTDIEETPASSSFVHAKNDTFNAEDENDL